MSKKFYAIHRETGKKWKSSPFTSQHLIMEDSGEFCVCTCHSDGWNIKSLNMKEWKIIWGGEDETKNQTS